MHTISKSINIPRENYRWIVVVDSDKLPSEELIPDNCEIYLHQNINSIVGHSQRNYALELITTGWIYSNDDDTVIHPQLWENIKDVTADFISFTQIKSDLSINIVGDLINIGSIDSHNFIVNINSVSDLRFVINKYEADGIFAVECYAKAITKIFINKALSVYNSLRPID